MGFFLYLALRNDLSWKLLSDAERARVLHANALHNTRRPDYAEPEQYAGGLGFDSSDDRLLTRRGRSLHDFLRRTEPAAVLEVGPGSGFYTRLIVTYPSVRRYCAVDINAAFLRYLGSRLSAARPGLEYQLVHGGVGDVSGPFDAAVLLSTVHHIPDRTGLFRMLAERLRPGGRVLAADPAHYAVRLAKLVRSCLGDGYLTARYRRDLVNISTHHFCTVGEYERICRLTGFRLNSVELLAMSRKLMRLVAPLERIGLKGLRRWAAAEIAVELESSFG